MFAFIQVIFRVTAHGPKCRDFQVSEREIPLLLSASARSLKLKRGDHHLFLVTGVLARFLFRNIVLSCGGRMDGKNFLNL